MGKNVMLLAGPKDLADLTFYAESLGLSMIPAEFEKIGKVKLDDPVQRPLVYLSFLPADQLHPSPPPCSLVSDVTDPVIEFTRPYYSPPHLVAGRLYFWDDLIHSSTVAPYFRKLARWVAKVWTPRSEDGYYIGPEASHLIGNAGAVIAYLPPGTTIRKAIP